MEKPLRYYELHAEVCKTFGHPKRLMVISALRNGELTVTEIAERTNIDISNLSQHLHVFRDKGLVTTRRDGTKVFYKLSHPNIAKALDLMSTFLDERISSSLDLIKEA
jgi:ArsR family transcriptional regulator